MDVGYSEVILAPIGLARSRKAVGKHGEPQSVEASGWYARILQHEIDHLRGTLYIDRMETRTFTSLDNWSRFWKGKPVRDVVEGLSNPLGPIR